MEKRLDFTNYQDAMRYAKEYAQKTSKSTTIVRNGHQWQVLYEETHLVKNLIAQPLIDHSHIDLEDYNIPDISYHSEQDNDCPTCDTPLDSSGECYNCEID